MLSPFDYHQGIVKISSEFASNSKEHKRSTFELDVDYMIGLSFPKEKRMLLWAFIQDSENESNKVKNKLYVKILCLLSPAYSNYILQAIKKDFQNRIREHIIKSNLINEHQFLSFFGFRLFELE